ncbi:MAG: hypothetical protein CSB48_07045 [Proteobacteria bacterium]|nr:MAG: hypothetical protein CSB48_07045 [Pseudomonadota bacterium]
MTVDKLAAAFATLEPIHPRCQAEVGQPDSAGWVDGDALRDAESGEFNRLLKTIGINLNTERRKVIAACFALRFGWLSGIAFGPFLINETVPDVRLCNLSLKFSKKALFEKAALHRLQVFDKGEPWQPPIHQLQAALIMQAQPVVNALQRWSEFPRQAIWAQIASSWSAQCAQLLQALGRVDETMPLLNSFFAESSLPTKSLPRIYPVTFEGHRRYFHESASCCLYYKVSGGYCESCPLIDEDERLRKNKECLRKTVF